ncbi:hypothetical protein U1Q18_015574 [Sarracenia purpurea var. burkii]
MKALRSAAKCFRAKATHAIRKRGDREEAQQERLKRCISAARLYLVEKRKVGGDPVGRNGSAERGIPATSSAAMTANGGVSTEKGSLISVVELIEDLGFGKLRRGKERVNTE